MTIVKKLWQIDVFSREALKGNPAAVVFDADDLSAELMQSIAREKNLSETVFLLRPSHPGKADYRVRIFTPRSELPFAGHPTLASAHAFLARGGDRKGKLVRQECGIGIVPIEIREQTSVGGTLLVMTQGVPVVETVDLNPHECAAMLGCADADIVAPIASASTGVRWMIVHLRTWQAVAALTPQFNLVEAACRTRKLLGVTVFALQGDLVKVRSFAPGEGIPEDPVCGSGNGSVAAYIASNRLLGRGDFRYWAEQGHEIQRGGQVLVECVRSSSSGTPIVRVGGYSTTVIEGELRI